MDFRGNDIFIVQKQKTESAMERYKVLKRQEREILDCRVMHRNTLRRINGRRLALERDRDALHEEQESLREKVVNASFRSSSSSSSSFRGSPRLKSPRRNPNRVLEQTGEEQERENDLKRQIKQMEREMKELELEKEDKTDRFQSHVSLLESELIKLDDEELLLIRGVEAEKGIVQFRKKDKKGRQLLEEYRNAPHRLCETFHGFFEQHMGKAYEDLRHFDLEAFKEVFSCADANETMAVEEQDLTLLIRRLLGKYGITSEELERILLLLGVEPLEQKHFSQSAFFSLGLELHSLVLKKGEELEDIRLHGMTHKKLKLREAMAEQSQTERDEIERKYADRINPLKEKIERSARDGCESPLRKELKELRDQKNFRRSERIQWATTATILSTDEKTKLRSMSLSVSSPPKHPYDHPVVRVAPSPPSQKTSEGASPRPPPRQHRQRSPPIQQYQGEKEKYQSRMEHSLALMDKEARIKELTESNLGRGFRSVADMQEEADRTAFNELFNLVSHESATITCAHLTEYFKLFAACGCDEGEGEIFLQTELKTEDGVVLTGLTFEQFVMYSGAINDRLGAAKYFQGLSHSSKLKHLSHREGLPLRRFEKLFEQSIATQQKLLSTTNSKRSSNSSSFSQSGPASFRGSRSGHQRRPGTSSFLSNRAYLLEDSPSSTCDSPHRQSHSSRLSASGGSAKTNHGHRTTTSSESQQVVSSTATGKAEEPLSIEELKSDHENHHYDSERQRHEDNVETPSRQTRNGRGSRKSCQQGRNYNKRPVFPMIAGSRQDRLITLSDFRSIQDTLFLEQLQGILTV